MKYPIIIAALLIAFLLSGCVTSPIEHKDRISLFGSHCVENAEKFRLNYNQQKEDGPDKWSKLLIIWWSPVDQSDMGARPNPLSKLPPPQKIGHMVCVFQHNGKLWVHDDSTIITTRPIGGATLADKNNPEKLGRLCRPLDSINYSEFHD